MSSPIRQRSSWLSFLAAVEVRWPVFFFFFFSTISSANLILISHRDWTVKLCAINMDFILSILQICNVHVSICKNMAVDPLLHFLLAHQANRHTHTHSQSVKILKNSFETLQRHLQSLNLQPTKQWKSRLAIKVKKWQNNGGISPKITFRCFG